MRELEAQMPHMKVEDLSLRCQLGPWSLGHRRLSHQFPALSPQPYIEEICQNLRGDVFQKFIER